MKLSKSCGYFLDHPFAISPARQDRGAILHVKVLTLWGHTSLHLTINGLFIKRTNKKSEYTPHPKMQSPKMNQARKQEVDKWTT